MKLAAAQTIPFPNNTKRNISSHVKLIERAATHGVKLIMFPEMSLTSYEREMAKELAFTENDIRLHQISQLAVAHNIVIIAGAPIESGKSLYIGSFIFLPDKTISIYTKQFLHEGEEKYFTPCEKYNPSLHIENQKLSVAICSDISHPVHAVNAATNNTSLYLASIFYTPNGIDEGYATLSSYATKHKMNVLMANYGGPAYTYQAGGRSAYWDRSGTLIASLAEEGECLLIVDTNTNDFKIDIVVA